MVLCRLRKEWFAAVFIAIAKRSQLDKPSSCPCSKRNRLRIRSLYVSFCPEVGRKYLVTGSFFLGALAFSLSLTAAVTMAWLLLIAMSGLDSTSVILFRKVLGAKTKSICANLSGVHGLLKPSVETSLYVHFL